MGASLGHSDLVWYIKSLQLDNLQLFVALHARPFFLPVGFLSDQIMKISYQIIYQFLNFFGYQSFYQISL